MTWIKTYDKKFRVNKRTGKNYDLVIEKVNGLLSKMALENHKKFRYLTYEDLYNELVCITISGIKSFDKSKDAKFSTFLHVHLTNKMISLIRKDRKQANNASKISTVGLNTELPLSSVVRKNERKDESPRPYVASERDSLYQFVDPIEKVDLYLTLEKIMDSVEEDTAYAIREVYLKDRTLREVSKEIGISAWTLTDRIRRLHRKFGDLKIKNDNYYPNDRITGFVEGGYDNNSLKTFVRKPRRLHER